MAQRRQHQVPHDRRPRVEHAPARAVVGRSVQAAQREGARLRSAPAGAIALAGEAVLDLEQDFDAPAVRCVD